MEFIYFFSSIEEYEHFAWKYGGNIFLFQKPLCVFQPNMAIEFLAGGNVSSLNLGA